MRADEILGTLHRELYAELTERVLPFWTGTALDSANGGFVGAIDAHGDVVANAAKSAILNSRILWTFSAALRTLGGDAMAAATDRAEKYFKAHFLDPAFGGVFWMVDKHGRALDSRKLVYAQAFAIYALAEHYRATGNVASLEDAVGIFRLIEAYAHDPLNGGYQEAFSREWKLLADARLSDVDRDAPKSMNAHLHLLEAYTVLFRVWRSTLLRERLIELVELFLGRIIAPHGRSVQAFFDERWVAMNDPISFGHDIETSWLLCEASAALGDSDLDARVRRASLRIATAVLDNGFDRAHGGIYAARRLDGALVTDKEWWPQAEAIVGFVRAYDDSGDERFLDAAYATWSFARDQIRDLEQGEWRWRVTRDGTPIPGREIVGPWKCPYHHARACLEIIARAGAQPGIDADTRTPIIPYRPRDGERSAHP